jgi:hypothetical protein
MTAPRMRAGTADRQAAVDGLARHFTDGRLDANEFDERVATAYGATYLDELPDLFADLPPDEQSHRSGLRRLDHQGAQFGPADRSAPWSGPQRPPRSGPPMQRPPLFLAAFVMLAMIFSISALAHGFFPFPLIWVAVVFLLLSRGARRRRWSESGHDSRRR